MSDVILHHFDDSPFSEKIRLILGHKQLPWKSVTVPIMLPKPDVVALTGGYRRTPFLQVGADIYCDSALMARVIDRIAPEPALYPAGATGVQNIIAQWADSSLFWSAVPYAMQPAGIMHMFRDAPPDFLPALGADRAAMTAGMRRATPTDAAAQLGSYLGWIESMLGDRPFLLGAQPCIADFSVVHCVWFVHRVPPVAGLLAPYGKLLAWFERMTAIGHGRSEPLSSADAIAIARAGGHAETKVEPGLGYEAGASVNVYPTDYASDPVTGTLVGLAANEVVIARTDERAGTVHVHFPRVAFQIKKAG